MATRKSTLFDVVKAVGCELPGVTAATVRRTKKAETPVLKRDGRFMAGLASHPSAEPGTLVVRADLEERELLIEDAPDTYYLTDYYRRWPLILVRLSQVDRDALRDLLSVSWRLTGPSKRR